MSRCGRKRPRRMILSCTGMLHDPLVIALYKSLGCMSCSNAFKQLHGSYTSPPVTSPLLFVFTRLHCAGVCDVVYLVGVFSLFVLHHPLALVGSAHSSRLDFGGGFDASFLGDRAFIASAGREVPWDCPWNRGRNDGETGCILAG